MISDKPAADLIRELNQTDETEHLEAKLASEIGQSTMETVCSLSNEPDLGGGTILLGVEKEEMALFPVFAAVGVPNVDQAVSDLSSRSASMFNIPVRIDVRQEIVDGQCIIRVDVPELLPIQKPLYFRSQGLPRGAFRRIGSTDQRCTDDDLLALFQARTREAPDRHVVNDAALDDIDPEAIASYRRARADVNPLAEELNWSDEDLLRSLNCLVRNNDRVQVTRAGLVTFGKAPALRRIDPSNRIDYIRISGKNWVPRSDSAAFESLELRGPALRMVGRVIAAVLDDLPRVFRLEEGNPQRTDAPLIPERVIREAVVNAVAHRNYQAFSPVQILRYSNRIEIRNPGYSLKSQERFDEPGSALRNPHIAEILHETRFAETKGSGIRVMRQKMTEMGLTEPTFISSREDDQFSAIFLFHHFLNEEDWTWLSMFGEFGLDNEQMRALIFIREMGAIDNAAYRHLNQVDTLSASLSLRRLKEHGLVEAKGSGSRTYYVPTSLFAELGHAASIHGSAVSMHAKGGFVAPSMHANGGPSPADGLPPALVGRIAKLKKRIEPDTAETLILEICRHRPTSADDIANILGKRKSYLTNKYLYKMVKEGKLNYTIPEMVKHPAQKYRAVNQSGRRRRLAE